MADVLSLCAAYPRLELQPGEVLIEEKRRTDRLYVLERGGFDVIRQGVRLAHIAEPGAFLGEISAVLESAPTANVDATLPSTVRVIEGASAAVQVRPELTLAIARLRARRGSAMTASVVDIKRQYAGSDTHLGVMDRVITSLITTDPQEAPAGSERTDVPDY